MTYSIVYSSATGNTARLAQAIRDALPPSDCLYFGPPDPAAQAAELIFAGFWTDKGVCCQAMADFLSELDGKRVALFGTAGFGGEEAYFNAILDRVRALLPPGTDCAGGHMCQGKMPPAVRARYAALLEKDPSDAKARMLLDNFDRALSHPDQSDLDGAADWARGLLGSART